MEQNIVERARRYLAKTPPAISGSGGDGATYRIAVALVKGFDLGTERALPLLREWNAQCVPPWPESGLRSKLASAAKSTRPAGWLLGPDKQVVLDEAAQKAAKRRQWPSFTKPSPADIERIAARRHVSAEAVYLMVCHQHLWRCCWQGEECFAFQSGTFAQVRRMDGKPFQKAGGESVKALNLPGSEGRFLNPGGPGNPDVPVLLTEGPAGLLESAEAVLRADRKTGTDHSVALCAAVSAGSRFTRARLDTLAGRRVRIIPDADPAGQSAAAAWLASLRSVHCTVDCIRLPAGCKDLGDALRTLPPRDPFWITLISF
ncbi:MAG TPA: toprim domain-containing protein [Verrucomicrobiales bacterium]|nr:toprim domain-containing protein [Verrucomicrobiales bacterium]